MTTISLEVATDPQFEVFLRTVIEDKKIFFGLNSNFGLGLGLEIFLK